MEWRQVVSTIAYVVALLLLHCDITKAKVSKAITSRRRPVAPVAPVAQEMQYPICSPLNTVMAHQASDSQIGPKHPVEKDKSLWSEKPPRTRSI